jgi:hypothetical protein
VNAAVRSAAAGWSQPRTSSANDGGGEAAAVGDERVEQAAQAQARVRGHGPQRLPRAGGQERAQARVLPQRGEPRVGEAEAGGPRRELLSASSGAPIGVPARNAAVSDDAPSRVRAAKSVHRLLSSAHSASAGTSAPASRFGTLCPAGNGGNTAAISVRVSVERATSR